MGKIWKNSGEEDKFIKKLIKQGKINRYTKPSKLKVDYPSMFGEFTVSVIRNHLCALKRANGVHLDGESGNETDDDHDNAQAETVAVNVNAESKLPGNIFDDTISGFNYICHRNYPVICEVYKDPDTECDKVTLVMTLPAGSQNVIIEISDNGASATIKYKWCQTMYDMRELYEKLLAAKQFNIHHPRVLCVKRALEKYRKKMDAVPEAVNKVIMPNKVQTSGDSWSHLGIKKKDGTQILMADFPGFVKDYIEKSCKVKFD